MSDVTFVELKSLVQNPDNPRIIRDDKFQKLILSVCEFPEMLEKRPLIVVSRPDGKFMSLGGNQRLKAIQTAVTLLPGMIKELPEKEERWLKSIAFFQKGVPVHIADDWTDEQRREFILKDNISYGEHDWDIIANTYDAAEIVEWGLDIPDMKAEVNEPEDDNYETDLPDHPQTIEGDVFQLGPHRLICGSCEDIDTIAKLMDGRKANLTFTSPPYWVGMAYETQKSEEEIDEFISNVAIGHAYATDPTNGRIVINTGTSSIHRIEKKRKVEILPLIDKWQREFRVHGWLLRHLRIWVKSGQLPASITPKTDVVDQHNEYIGTFEKEWSQIITYWNPDSPQRGQERLGTPWAQQGVWADVKGQKSAEGRHIAAFPLEIPFRNILLYTKPREIVFDSFGGSGTTLIAAEQTGRIAYLSEISPAYCDVIIQRFTEWIQLHNLSYQITRNGQPYEHKPPSNEGAAGSSPGDS